MTPLPILTNPVLTIMRDAVSGDVDESIVHAEAALRAAQLAGDVNALDALIHDDLLFTGPDGRLATKADDLAAHRDGVVRFLTHTPRVLTARPVGPDVVVTSLRAHLTLIAGGANVDLPFCYTRVWARGESTGWRVVAGHVSAGGE